MFRVVENNVDLAKPPWVRIQIEKYGSWLVKIFRKFIFTSWDLNEKLVLINFQQLKCKSLHKN